jgi:hypothetical protein
MHPADNQARLTSGGSSANRCWLTNVALIGGFDLDGRCDSAALPPRRGGSEPDSRQGKVTDACHPRHAHAESLDFLEQVAKAYPWVKLHIVVNNRGTYKRQRVKAPPARNARITLQSDPPPRDPG